MLNSCFSLLYRHVMLLVQAAGEWASSAAEGVWNARDGDADSSQRIEGWDRTTE